MFKANPDFLTKLLHDPDLATLLMPKGRAVLAEAKATAPVESGAYRESLEVWADVTDRVQVRVGSRDPKVPYAADINVKTGHLARALDAAERGD